MPEYQAYLVGPDGHIVQRVELVCTDDEVAREQAKLLQSGTTSSFGRRLAGSRSSGRNTKAVDLAIAF